MLGLGSSLIRGSFTEAFTPLTIGGLSLWLQNGVGVDVGQWDDSSGNDNHIVQGTVDTQAAVVDGGLDFEGTEGDFYSLSSDIAIAEQGNFSIFMVIKIECCHQKIMVKVKVVIYLLAQEANLKIKF